MKEKLVSATSFQHHGQRLCFSTMEKICVLKRCLHYMFFCIFKAIC